MKANQKEKIFLTVGNEKQKSLCQKLISLSMPKIDINVICDSDIGNRIGSGGAFLQIISNYCNYDDKVIIVNSGGISKRSINYAIRGKAFTCLYKDKEIFLLQLLIENALKLLSKLNSGVIVCCGDILIEADGIEFKNDTNFVVGAFDSIQTGTRHGVLFYNSDKEIEVYSHKECLNTLENLAEQYNTDKVLVDTGLVFFNSETVKILSELNEKYSITKLLSDNKIDLNLYPDIVSLFSKDINFEKYISNETADEIHREIKIILYNALKNSFGKVCFKENKRFTHFGTIKESLDNIIDFSNNKKSYLLINSVCDNDVFVKSGTLIENSLLKNGCVVGENSIVSDVFLTNQVVQSNKLVCGFRLVDGKYITVVCDLEENSKEYINGEEIWYIPRFFKGTSFDESYLKFINGSDEETFSLDYCVNNADFNYHYDHYQYLLEMKAFDISEKYLSLRDDVVKAYFQNVKMIENLYCKKNYVCLDLPVRVNLSGTWTDAMPYCVQNGGAVINMAISVEDKKPIQVIAEKIDGNRIEFCSDGVSAIYDFNEENSDNLSDFILHKSALSALGINKKTIIKTGLRLTTIVKGIDKGSGLGTSSILLAGCVKAISELLDLNYSQQDIFNAVFLSEQLMKTGGGWQDQAGGLTPGIKLVKSNPGLIQKLDIRNIEIKSDFENKLNNSLVLIPTNQRHFGRFIVSDVAKRYLDKNETSLKGFERIKNLNDDVLKAIEKSDFEAFSNCINTHFETLKMISPSVSTDEIESIIGKCKSVCQAVSVCGAGAGGYLLASLKEGSTAEDLQMLMNKEFSQIKSKVLKIKLEGDCCI